MPKIATSKSHEYAQKKLRASFNTAASVLGITDPDLAKIMNMDPRHITRIRNSEAYFDVNKSEHYNAAQFVKMATEIELATQRTGKKAHQWFKQYSTALQQIPLEFLKNGPKSNSGTRIEFLLEIMQRRNIFA